MPELHSDHHSWAQIPLSTHWVILPDSFSTVFVSVAAQILPRMDGHPHWRVWLCLVDIVTQTVIGCWIPCALSGTWLKTAPYFENRFIFTESLQAARPFLLAAATLHLRELASSLWTMYTHCLFPNVTFLLTITLPVQPLPFFFSFFWLFFFLRDIVLKLSQLFRGLPCGWIDVWDFIISFNSWSHCTSTVRIKHMLNALQILLWSSQRAYKVSSITKPFLHSRDWRSNEVRWLA